MTMNTSKKRQQAGFTLIEIALVLTISAALIIFGYRQYLQFAADANITKILYNVDTLAQAAADYYWANCGWQVNPQNASTIPGTLNPNSVPTPPNPYPINIKNDFTKNGYLPAPLSLVPNNIVNDTGLGYGYFVQFNETLTPLTTLVCGDVACTVANQHQQQIGTTVYWGIQVSVQLEDPANAPAYKQLLVADCISELDPSDPRKESVLPCDQAPSNASHYLVFQRLPSQPTNAPRSPISQNRAALQMFNQPYTTYPITTLTSTSHNPEYQYFLCTG